MKTLDETRVEVGTEGVEGGETVEIELEGEELEKIEESSLKLSRALRGWGIDRVWFEGQEEEREKIEEILDQEVNYRNVEYEGVVDGEGFEGEANDISNQDLFDSVSYIRK